MARESGGIPVGLDFTGGTAVVARFASPVSEDEVRRAIPGRDRSAGDLLDVFVAAPIAAVLAKRSGK